MTAVLFVLVTTFLASAVEAIEMVTIVLGVGATRGWRATIIGAVVVIGAIGLILQRVVTRIPRSLLQLVVGILLTTFGTFWSLEGLGVEWPVGDGAILGLLALYLVTAGTYISIERRRVLGFSPGA